MCVVGSPLRGSAFPTPVSASTLDSPPATPPQEASHSMHNLQHTQQPHSPHSPKHSSHRPAHKQPQIQPQTHTQPQTHAQLSQQQTAEPVLASDTLMHKLKLSNHYDTTLPVSTAMYHNQQKPGTASSSPIPPQMLGGGGVVDRPVPRPPPGLPPPPSQAMQQSSQTTGIYSTDGNIDLMHALPTASTSAVSSQTQPAKPAHSKSLFQPDTSDSASWLGVGQS